MSKAESDSLEDFRGSCDVLCIRRRHELPDNCL